MKCNFLKFVFLSSLIISTVHAGHQGQEAALSDVYSFPLSQNENYSDYVFIENIFTPAECEKIIKYGISLGTQAAEVGAEQTGEKGQNLTIRKSKTAWIGHSKKTNWIFERLAKIAQQVNDETYGFDLTGFYEKIQFTEYESPGGHYTWHRDSGEGEFSTRKLSIVIQLSDPKNYKGGELQFFDKPIISMPKKQGAATIFPPYNMHRVTPLTTGKRYSLVIWVSGPPFR